MDTNMIFIGGLFLVGGFLHLIAWTELEEFNWFDIVMRGAPPFEDLSATGQACVIGSWICAVIACGFITVEYVVPRFASLGLLQ